MRTKKKVPEARNWALVFICAILIVLGGALAVLAVINIALFGWWSLLVGAGGVTTVAAAIMSIIKNDPSWILLDLILPG
ncbi:MAG: hypothetical protein WBP22_05860 [Candidatus Saccharimonas sp.]